MAAVLRSDAYLAQLDNVYKSFGARTAVDGLSLAIKAGELIALLGPNGAGKTTAISMMLGLQPPDAGSVSLFGRSPSEVQARRGIGVMLQEEALTSELKVRELLDLVAAYYPDPYPIEEVMTLTRTSGFRNIRYGKLSGGQKRLVQFALAICGRPKLLFLDEPTTGLDIDARETLWATIREFVARGTAVLLTTHYLEEAEALADRVVVVAGGREIASGTVEQLRGVVNRKRVCCSTSVDVALIKSWPEVISCETAENGRLQLTVTDAESVTRRLLATDPALRDLEVYRAGLNEAFRQLTKESA
jgi:ABC-2 type transport system ATP-binding protein